MFDQLFDGLTARDGIWHVDAAEAVSYPADGNETCFQVEDNSFWFKHRNACISGLFEKHVPPGGLVLDVGGGNGYVSRALQADGFNVVLVEPYLQGCINARERQIEHVVCGTLEKANFPPQSCDAVGIFDVLEHIEDRATFLAQIRKCLKPGGKLIVSVPAFQFLWSDEDVLAGHYLRYTRSSLKNELHAAGFDEQFSSYLFGPLVLPILLLRAIPGRLNVNLKRDAAQDHKDPIWMERMLKNEKRRIGKGRQVKIGSSILAVYKVTG